MKGFQTLVKNKVLLQVGVPATVDAILELGQVGEVVNVEADVAAINTVNATIGNAFTQVQVRQLPVGGIHVITPA